MDEEYDVSTALAPRLILASQILPGLSGLTLASGAKIVEQ